MNITPVPHGLESILTDSSSTGVRSPGLHMSTIYNSLYQELEPARYKKGTQPDPLRLGAGLVLERIVENGLRERLQDACGRPGEFIEPEYGIAFSPDLLFDNGLLRVGEIKLTWMSSRTMPREPSNGFPPKFDKYVHQIANYCRCLGTRHARLIVYFVNGDYRLHTPEMLAWDIEFTQRELDEYWSASINHGKHTGLIV